ncbi:MAG: outer membrane beta-barrel protein [Rickettsiales bacterium]|nr:outer membrane beta-barrel protein [Rickettsiales bacterium]
MRKVLLALVVLFLALPSSANALLPVSAYVGVRGGLNSLNKKAESAGNSAKTKDGSPFVSANVGVGLFSFRFELEYAYRINMASVTVGSSRKDIAARSVMGNVYYNFIDIPFVRLYVNGGVGSSEFSGSSHLVDKKDNFLWSAGFGATVTLMNIISVDAGYRYIDAGKIKTNVGLSLDQQSHDIYAGLRFGF